MRRKVIAASLSLLLGGVVQFLAACNQATVQAYISLISKIAAQLVVLAGAPQSLADKVAGDGTIVGNLYGDFSKAAAGDKSGILDKIDAELTVTQNDLGQILALSQVKDSKTIKAVQGGLAVAIIAIDGIYTIANGNGPSVPSKVASMTVRTLPIPSVVLPKNKRLTPDQLKAAYNSAVAGYPQAQIK